MKYSNYPYRLHNINKSGWWLFAKNSVWHSLELITYLISFQTQLESSTSWRNNISNNVLEKQVSFSTIQFNHTNIFVSFKSVIFLSLWVELPKVICTCVYLFTYLETNPNCRLIPRVSADCKFLSNWPTNTKLCFKNHRLCLTVRGLTVNHSDCCDALKQYSDSYCISFIAARPWLTQLWALSTKINSRQTWVFCNRRLWI